MIPTDEPKHHSIDESSAQQKLGKFTIVVGIVVSVVAVAALILHVADPTLKIDSIVVALLVLAALPWLGEIFQKISLPGGASVEYRNRIRNAEEKAAQAEETAGRASEQVIKVAEQVDDAVESGQDARGEFQRSEDVASEGMVSAEAGPPELKIQDLAARYNEIRARQQPGFERTSAMTAIVREIQQLAKTADDFDWRSALTSEDRGIRLAGYAYLCARPQRGAAEPLVQALFQREDKPFGQYWALKALEAVAPQDQAIAGFLPELKEFQRKLGPRTDRGRECGHLIELIEHPDRSAQPAAG
jgi:hypothetical protein